jgi:hypothetical protein
MDPLNDGDDDDEPKPTFSWSPNPLPLRLLLDTTPASSRDGERSVSGALDADEPELLELELDAEPSTPWEEAEADGADVTLETMLVVLLTLFTPELVADPIALDTTTVGDGDGAGDGVTAVEALEELVELVAAEPVAEANSESALRSASPATSSDEVAAAAGGE